VWKREFEILGKELLDVRTADVIGFLDLYNLENLENPLVIALEQLS
jgi:hypothetical protein